MPLAYSCVLDDCTQTTSDPTSMLEHIEQQHDRRVSSSALPAPTFTQQIVAQGHEPEHREIACARCGKWLTFWPDQLYRHRDVGTIACVDPDTLISYPEAPNPKEQAMNTSVIEHITRPSKQTHRKWFATLTPEQKRAARAHVEQLIVESSDGQHVAQSDAWQIVMDAAHIDVSPHAASTRVERVKRAKDERVQLIAAQISGKRAPATPNLDALEAEAAHRPGPKPTPKTAKQPSETTTRARAVSGTQFTGNGKSRRNLSDLAYDFTRGVLSEDSRRMTATEFREWLAANALITEPDTTSWTLTLPNGNVLAVTVPT